MGRGPAIVAIGHYLPPHVRKNNYFYDPPPQGLGLETSEEWIITRTGIKERHVAADDEFASGMGVKAAQVALEMAGKKPADLGGIFLATATPDFQLPPTANIVQARLDSNVHTPAADIGNACNGALMGLQLAFGQVIAGFASNVLVIGTERLTRIVDYTKRDSCILFGDGAGAALVDSVDDPGPMSFVMGSDGTGGEHIFLRGTATAGVCPATPESIAGGRFLLAFEGNKVFKTAVRRMTETSKAALEKAGLQARDVTWLIPHQANDRILTSVAEHLGLGDRGISYIADIGNISSASIFVAMCKMYEAGWLQQGDILLLTAIGSGYNYGAGVIQWNVPNPTPRLPGNFADYKLT